MYLLSYLHRNEIFKFARIKMVQFRETLKNITNSNVKNCRESSTFIQEKFSVKIWAQIFQF